jgi:hypothetical protein
MGLQSVAGGSLKNLVQEFSCLRFDQNPAPRHAIDLLPVLGCLTGFLGIGLLDRSILAAERNRAIEYLDFGCAQMQAVGKTIQSCAAISYYTYFPMVVTLTQVAGSIRAFDSPRLDR